MGFDLGAELSAVRGQGYDLHSKYLNPQLPRTLRTLPPAMSRTVSIKCGPCRYTTPPPRDSSSSSGARGLSSQSVESQLFTEMSRPISPDDEVRLLDDDDLLGLLGHHATVPARRRHVLDHRLRHLHSA